VLGAARNWLTLGGARLATRLVLLADAVCVTLKRYRDHLRRWYWAGNTWHVPLFTAAEAVGRPAGAPAQEILMLAAHAPHRGLPVLLEAFQRVQAVFPGATLTVAGGDHLRFPGYLAAQREASRAIPNVRWLGHQTEAQLRAAFARASVVVIPALATTGASSVVHRAVGHGRPVIASDLPDLRAVAAEERLWLEFTPPGDAAALAARLAALLGDAARTEAMVRHNLAAAQTLTPSHIAARYLDVFAHVLAARRATPADRTLTLPD
jgi:glycosyltransferase involved in cell wall biosynthesis